MATDPLALAAMVAWCKWNPLLQVTSEVILLDGNGTTLLTLPSLHVTAVEAVTVTDRYDATYSLTIGTGSADVEWSDDGTLSLCSMTLGCWPAGKRNIEVRYSGGYAPDDPEAAEVQAVLDSIGKRVGPMSAGIKSKSMGKARFDYFEPDLTAVEQMVLNRYRIIQAR